MHRTTRLLIAVLAVAAFVTLPAAASAAPKLQVGVQVVSIDGATPASTIDEQLDVARRSGGKLVRVGIPWDALQPTAAGSYDPAGLAAADHVIAGLRARGLRAILVMVSTPCWASAAPASVKGDCSGPAANRDAVTSYPPARPADYVAVSTFMAKRFGSALAAFEIWNEPDLKSEAYWAGPDKVRRYVALTKALYKPLKRANPQAKVLAGAFVGFTGEWLRALYRAGIKGYYDALSMHFYAQTLYGLRLNHAIQRHYHDRKPVWVTESGWTTCTPVGRRTPAGHTCVSEEGQGRFISDLVTSLRRKPAYVRALIDYAVSDGSDDGDHFGLVDSSGAAKPSLAALFAALRPTPRTPRKVRLHLTASGGRVTASGSGPGADAYDLQVVTNGRLVYRKGFYLGPDGSFSLRLPARLGTVMAVRVVYPWLGTSARASIGTS